MTSIPFLVGRPCPPYARDEKRDMATVAAILRREEAAMVALAELREAVAVFYAGRLEPTSERLAAAMDNARRLGEAYRGY